jgi:hypothetical protein
MMKSSFAAMVDKTYAPFFAEAHLTPEQTMALKELIANKQSTNLDRGMSLLSDKTDAAKRIEISKQQNDDQASYNEQVKQLLGEDGAARLNDFEKALSERMTVNTFETQLPEAWALSSDQKKQLIDAMVEERQNFRYTTSLPSSTTQPLNVASLYSEDHIKQQVDDQQRLGQQFLSRAKDILSPDQLKIYEQCLSNQQQMQAASLEMAAKMFAPK